MSEPFKKFIKESIVNPFFRKRNVNPWNKDIGDCAIRATALGLGIKYEGVCEMLGRKCKDGYGLVNADDSGDSGISLKYLKKRFNKYFDKVEDASEIKYADRPEEFKDLEFDPAFDESPDLGFTLDEFCEAYKGTGRYLIALVMHEKQNGPKGHIVYANLNEGKNYFIDTWDSGKLVVKAYMKIKYVLSKDDPRSVLYGKK